MPQTPFWHSLFVAWNPSPYLLEPFPYLLGNPSYVSWRKFPSTLVPSWLYTDPPPHSPSPLSSSQWFPLLKCMPSHEDIAISDSHSLIQKQCSKSCQTSKQRNNGTAIIIAKWFLPNMLLFYNHAPCCFVTTFALIFPLSIIFLTFSVTLYLFSFPLSLFPSNEIGRFPSLAGGGGS
jgi:hypothetical protein